MLTAGPATPLLTPNITPKKLWYPRVIFAAFCILAVVASVMLLDAETIYAGIHSPWAMAASWLFIVARGISFLSYLARLKDYWSNEQHRQEKRGIIISIVLTLTLAILFFAYHFTFFSFSTIGNIGSGIVFSFFLASQFVGLIPRLLRSGDAPKHSTVSSINLKNENLAIACSLVGALIFLIVVASKLGFAALNLFSGGPAVLVAIFSLYSLCGMVVSTSSYIGRCIDLFTTKTLLDRVSGLNNDKTAMTFNAEKKGMVLGMFLGPGIGAILVWVVLISVPLSGGLGAPFAIALFLFGNIGVGGAFGARIGAVLGWFFGNEAAATAAGVEEKPLSSDNEPSSSPGLPPRAQSFSVESRKSAAAINDGSGLPRSQTLTPRTGSHTQNKRPQPFKSSEVLDYTALPSKIWNAPSIIAAEPTQKAAATSVPFFVEVVEDVKSDDNMAHYSKSATPILHGKRLATLFHTAPGAAGCRADLPRSHSWSHTTNLVHADSSSSDQVEHLRMLAFTPRRIAA
ncbi:hypothetical protein BH10PSE19_BH10PSE19_17280 [soil metagenome]